MASPAAERYDVFVSYRREDGAQVARLIRYALLDRGLSVFLDVESLGSGHFDERLLDTIAATPGFVVILSRDALARCGDPGDWMRREIARAVETQRTIVPILGEGFSFGSEPLPAELAALQRHNGLKYNHEYFGAMIARLLEYLGRPATPAPGKAKSVSPEFVFLDFDGVLRPEGSPPYVFDADCLRRFEALMREHPGTRIVITSSWRLGMTQREMTRQFSPDIRARIAGATPQSDDDGPARHNEILLYLRQARRSDARWIAIDDDAARYRGGCRNLLLVDPARGFDRAAAERFAALAGAGDAG